VTYNGVEMRDIHRLVVEKFHEPLYVGWYLFSLIVLGLHLSHGVAATAQSIGLSGIRNKKVQRAGILFAVRDRRRLHQPATLRFLRRLLMKAEAESGSTRKGSSPLDSRIPSGPLEQKWDTRKFENKLVNPAKPAQAHGDCRRYRPRRCVVRRDPRRARLPDEGVHLPRKPAPRALDCRAGRVSTPRKIIRTTATRFCTAGLSTTVLGRRTSETRPVMRSDERRRVFGSRVLMSD
jgi:hypothetical protein